jgi:hypothetical protein
VNREGFRAILDPMVRAWFPVFFALVLSLTACAGRAPAPEADRAPSAATLERAPIEISAEYRLRCVGDSAERTSTTSKEAFFPDASPFREANGGLVPVLTARLQKLSDDLVMEAATATCGGGGRVAVARPLRLRSGRWSAPLPFGCARDRCAVSPYDDSVRDDVEFSREPAILSYVEKRSAFGGSAEDWVAAKTCSHPIRATACYGDCMSDERAAPRRAASSKRS